MVVENDKSDGETMEVFEKKECSHCGEEFTPRTKQQRICDRLTCRKELTCCSCGTKFMATMTQTGTYCNKCNSKANKKGRERQKIEKLTEEIDGSGVVERDPLLRYFQLVRQWRKKVELNTLERQRLDREEGYIKGALDNHIKAYWEVLKPTLEAMLEPAIDRAEIERRRVKEREEHKEAQERSEEWRKKNLGLDA